MDQILQNILDVPGVGAALVIDGSGTLVGHRGRAVYDRALCEQLGATLAKAVDTVQLQQEDWESVSAQYADGKLLLRNLGAGSGRPHVLAVVADATLNASFATVAIRVAANKIKGALSGGAGSSMLSASQIAASAPAALAGSAPRPASGALGPSASAVTPADSRSVLANSGLSWSKTSSGGLSQVTVADPASAAHLTRCAKELARHVGPISKVYVQEAVRRVCADAPYSLASAGRLLEDLAGQIEDEADRAAFRKALEKT